MISFYRTSQGPRELSDAAGQVSEADRHEGKEVVDYGEDGALAIAILSIVKFLFFYFFKVCNCEQVWQYMLMVVKKRRKCSRRP